MADDPTFLSSWSPGHRASHFLIKYYGNAVQALSAWEAGDARPHIGLARALLTKWHTAAPFDLRRLQPSYPLVPSRCELDPSTGRAKPAEIDWEYGIAQWDECGTATSGRMIRRAELFVLRLAEVQARVLAEKVRRITLPLKAPVAALDPAHEELKQILKAGVYFEVLHPEEDGKESAVSKPSEASRPDQPSGTKRAGRRRMAATEAAEKAVDEFLDYEGITELNDPRLFAVRELARTAAEQEADPEQEGDPVISDRTIRRLILQRVAERRKRFDLPA